VEKLILFCLLSATLSKDDFLVESLTNFMAKTLSPFFDSVYQVKN